MGCVRLEEGRREGKDWDSKEERKRKEYDKEER